MLAYWRSCFPSAECLWIASQSIFIDALAASQAGRFSTLRVLALEDGKGKRIACLPREDAETVLRVLPCLPVIEVLHFHLCFRYRDFYFSEEMDSFEGLVALLVATLSVKGSCQSTCSALSAIFSYASTNRMSFNAAAGAGAAAALVAAVRDLALSANVIQAVCDALMEISHYLPTQFVNAGAVPALVGALRAHHPKGSAWTCAELQLATYASGALCIIANTPKGKEACAAADAAPALHLVLRTFASEKLVCKYASGALRHISAPS